MKQKTVATSDAEGAAKRKRWWLGGLSVALAVIGVAGIPDDLQTWHRWLSIMDIVEAIRWTALILAPTTLAIPLSLEVRDRLQRRRERRRITRAEALDMLATCNANRAIRRAARQALDLSDPLRRFKPHRFELLALLDEFEAAQPESVRDGSIDSKALHRWEGQRGRPKKRMRSVWRDLVDAGERTADRRGIPEAETGTRPDLRGREVVDGDRRNSQPTRSTVAPEGRGLQLPQ